jgi:hypothetical protein
MPREARQRAQHCRPDDASKFPANRENYRDPFNYIPSSLQMRGNNTSLCNNSRDEFPKNQNGDLIYARSE